VTNGMLLRFERSSATQRITCLFNLGPEAIRTPIARGSVLFSVNGTNQAELPGYSAVYLERSSR
jgi:hypothetical protein